VLLAVCILVFPKAGRCDIVELANGDRITGNVQDLTSGKLALDTTYAGRVSIDWSQVRTIATTTEFQVDLVGGQTVTGRIATVRPEEYTIGSAPATLAGEISGIRPPPGTGEGLLSDWHATADVGYTTTRGNANTTQFALQFRPERRKTRDSLKVDLQSLVSLSNSSAGNSVHSLEVRYDRYLSGRLFYFVLTKGEHDQTQSLRLRVHEGGGVGVRMRLGNKTQISTLTGLTFVQERFYAQNYQYGAEGLIGYELETRVLNQLQITSKGQLLPNFGDIGRYRSEWDSGVRVPFRRGVNFGFRLFHRFDSAPPSGARHADYGLISTIGTTF
jgi:hypothetical protein